MSQDCLKDKRVKRRLPSWLKRPLPSGENFRHVDKILSHLQLNTVCREACCPNLGECWSAGTATFMILGEVCTRNCRFCAVASGTCSPVEPDEPDRVARAAKELDLKHVVITSVTRDDLPDEGAGQFAKTIIGLRKELPQAAIEVLTPDFHNRSDCLDTVCNASPTIFNHNLETVELLSSTIRPQADYRRSLAVLEYVKKTFPTIYVKSGLMVGAGETDAQIHQSLRDLSDAGVQIVTVGQYLAPSKNHWPTKRYLPPEWFSKLRIWAQENLNFLYIFAGPFVRSSYLAGNVLDEVRV